MEILPCCVSDLGCPTDEVIVTTPVQSYLVACPTCGRIGTAPTTAIQRLRLGLQTCEGKPVWLAADSPVIEGKGRAGLRSGRSRVQSEEESPALSEQRRVRRSTRRSCPKTYHSDEEVDFEQPAANRQLNLQGTDKVCMQCTSLLIAP